MTSVLVVDDDNTLRRAVAHELRKQGFEVREASNVDDAVTQLRKSAPDVLLTDLRMEGRDGIDLLAELRSASVATVPVLMSGFATARDYQAATDLGAVKVLTKPFTPSEVLEAIQHALDCGTGFRGSVHGLSLIDLLQMFHFARRTIALRIEGNTDAVIEFQEGEIVHAEVGELSGVAALCRTLAVPSGAVRTSVPSTLARRSIDVPFQSLIMDVLREVDESTRGQRKAPEASAASVELDDAFGTWSSIPPTQATSAAEQQLSELGNILDRIAPNVGVGVVSRTKKTTTAVRNFEPDPAWLPVAFELCAVSERLTRQPCEYFEHVGETVAFAVLFAAAGDHAVVIDAPMIDRLSPQRFRSQVRQIAAFLRIGLS